MSSADENVDKKIGADEWRILTEKWFKNWDKDGNGLLDQSELVNGWDASFAPLPPPVPPKK
ncbi:MAG: hypothetical protein U0930_05740 [Pirellulales bacterium]